MIVAIDRRSRNRDKLRPFKAKPIQNPKSKIQNRVTNNPTSDRLPDSVQLSPNYTIPIVLTIAALPIAAVQIWVGAAIGIFGLFLTIQTVLIKLEFTTTTLNVYRGSTLIRTFPYREWENWQIFWPPLPILFYFKEVNSIHFLPIIFDARMLQTCLEYYRPQSPDPLN